MKNSYLLLIVILLLAVSGFSQSKKSQIISTTDTLWRFLNNRNSLGTSTFGFITGSDTTFIQSDGTILNFISSELLHNGSPIGGGGNSYWDRDTNGFLHPLTLSDYIKLDTTAIQGLDTAVYSHDAVPMWQIMDSIDANGGSGGSSEWTRDATHTDRIYPNNTTDSVVIAGTIALEPFTIYSSVGQDLGTESTSFGTGALANEDISANRYNVAIGKEAMTELDDGARNVGIGHWALKHISSGEDNMGIGFWSMISLTTGYNNTAIGSNTMSNVNSGHNNVSIGANAGNGIVSSSYNTFVGAGSGGNNSTGATAIGYRALQTVTGNWNTAIGYFASNRTNAGYGNTTIGYQALEENVSGDNNVSIGHWANRKCTGNSNVAIGYAANYQATTSYSNVYIGHQAHTSGTSIGGIGIGYQAQYQATGMKNTSIGWTAHRFLSSGTYNIALGHEAGYGVQTGSYNITLGYQAGKAMYMTGHYNVLIGNWVEADDKTANYQLNIANLIKGEIDNETVTIHDALVLNPVSAAPSSPTLGMLYCDSDDNHLYYYNGSTWVQID